MNADQRQQRRAPIRRLFIFISLVLVIGFDSAIAQEAEQTPAIERCRQFCARVYGDTGAEYDECAAACGEADGCHRDCKHKFGKDWPKVRTCLRRCMRRNEKPPAEPPVQL